MIVHLSCTVTGNVQGVSYRYWLKQRAKAFDLHGYVVNCPDGSVFFEAEGEKEKLQQLLELAGMGPMGATIEKVEPRWSMGTDHPFEGDFLIQE